MHTYALFGATGNTGSAILKYLQDTTKTPVRLNIFVRSAEKLNSSFPDLMRNEKLQINVIAGQLSDQAKVKEALKHVDIIHNCISTNMPTRGANTAQTVANSIIRALESIRSEGKGSFKPPTLLMNRALPLNGNLGQPSIIEKFVLWVLVYIYDDLRAAAKMYQSAAAAGLLKYIFVDAPSLHEAPAGERTGHKLVRSGHVEPALYYSDLGAAFVEVGARRDEFEGQVLFWRWSVRNWTRANELPGANVVLGDWSSCEVAWNLTL